MMRRYGAMGLGGCGDGCVGPGEETGSGGGGPREPSLGLLFSGFGWTSRQEWLTDREFHAIT
ncbi:unnamed protein product [Ectocarpus sp. CCAP 1310/34]|nr:unnamed protein product [Ectocarpus sp. CCAP 1310/34]